MKRDPRFFLCGFLLAGGLWAGWSLRRPGQDIPPDSAPLSEAPGRCPVCGMFVARHTAWLAEIRFADGQRVCFDGVKDLFKYYFDVERYAPGRATNDIRALEVSDYYAVRRMDGHQAWYVIGSDVLGPMGDELIPLATEQAAREFARDHHGTRVVTFGDVTREMVAGLDREPAAPARAEAPASGRR